MKGIIKSWIKSNPSVYNIVAKSLRQIYYKKSSIEKRKHGFRYDAPINPLGLIWVDPNKVTTRPKSSFNKSFNVLSDLSPVVGGDWDQHTRSLSDYDLFYSFDEHLNDNVPWEETDFYNRVATKIERGNWSYKWGIKTKEDLDNRCQNLDYFHQYISSNGYTLQSELRSSRTDPLEKDRSHRKVHVYPPELHEVTVHISRDGELLFHDGRNRMAIAQALELESIPVRVMVRHKEWQSARDKVYEGSISPSELDCENHPDIQLKKVSKSQ